MGDEAHVQKLAEEVDRVWLTGDTHPLWEILHPEAVLVLVEGHQTHGREPYIQITETFLREMKSRTFRFIDKTVKIWGDTAVVNQQCEMSFLLERDRYTDLSSITMTFARTDSRWQLVWTEVYVRTKLPGELLPAT